jgi:hypothetical protein
VASNPLDEIGIVRKLRETNARLLTENEALKGGDSGGTSGTMSDDALKPRVDFLHTAFLWLAGAIVTITVGLAALILNQGSGTNARIDKVADSVSSLNREVGVLSAKQDDANKKLDAISDKLDKPRR